MRYFKYIFTNYDNSLEIKLYNIKDFLIGKYIDSWKEYYKNRKKFTAKIAALMFVSLLISTFVSQLLLYILLIGKIAKKIISIGDAMYYMSLFHNLYNSTVSLIRIISSSNAAFVRLNAVKEFINQKPMVQKNGVLTLDKIQKIEFSHVYFRYPGKENYVLEDCSFTMEAGQQIGLVGENGCGKSTIVKLILRLYDVEEGEILLPSRYVPQDCKVGDKLNVFIYLDNEERLVATTLTPLVQVGQFACLEVAWINQYGAFLNWGLMKDLFVPFREQKMKMQVGKKYVVHAHLDDESYRIVASAKVDRYLSKEKAAYESGQEVDILIWQKTDLGFKAIINDEYSGLLYESEIFQPLHTGMRMKAYVKQVREDGKIDLLLQKPGQAKVEDFSATLLDYIREQGGRIALNDKSPAEEIYATFGVSKKTFKKAVGDLYKKHLVVLEEDGIRIRN